VELKLIGTRSNRDAIGAQVKVQAGELVQYDHVRAGGSYLSGNDPRLHFGLGERKSVDSIEIRWPSGAVEKLQSLKGQSDHRHQRGRRGCALSVQAGQSNRRPEVTEGSLLLLLANLVGNDLSEHVYESAPVFQ